MQKIKDYFLGHLWNSISRNKLTILIFHRVIGATSPYHANSITVDQFENQIRWLNQYCQVLPLDAAMKLLKDGKLPSGSVSITVDDGYLVDSFLISDVLRRYNCNATFFVTSDFENNKRLWNDQIIEAISANTSDSLDLSQFKLMKYNLSSEEEKIHAIKDISQRIKYFDYGLRKEITQELHTNIDFDPLNELLKPADIKKLVSDGMQIGSHSHTHPILHNLSDLQARDEIFNSKAIFDELLSDQVSIFAYPNGKYNIDFNQRDMSYVKQAGYQYALSSDWGRVSRTAYNCFCLPRFTPWDKRQSNYLIRLIMNNINLVKK